MFELTKIEDIKNLPWVGNFHSDSKLIEEVDEFILEQKDKTVQKKAIILLDYYAYGEETEEVTDSELKEYIEGIEDWANWC